MLYIEIAQSIKNKILNQEYKTSEKLPSEMDLAVMFNSTKMTIRKALEILIETGLIRSIPKSGYYVNSQEDIINFNSLNGNSLRYLHPTAIVTTEVFSFEKINKNSFLSSKFENNDYLEYYNIKRIRYLNDKIYSFEDIYMPVALFPNLNKETTENSIYSHVLDEGFHIFNNKKTVSANFLPKLFLKKFQPFASVPMLEISNIGYLTNGKIFEYSISHHVDFEISLITKFNTILK